ncbi:MAG: ribosomal protein L7/L12 [Agriterribacter sp.]
MNFFDYYQSHKNYFWVWEEDADVLAIAGGSTIGFREQVAEILTGIAENGLPPFGSFLLAMIATNKTMDDAVDNVGALIKINQQEGPAAQYTEIVTEAFTFLRLLQTVPQDYAIEKRRQILLQTIFAGSHNRINAPTSKGIVTGLKNNVHHITRLIKQKEFNTTVFLKDFRTIALLLRKFPTVQSIIDAMGDLPELDKTEIPLLEYQPADKKNYKDFVDALLDNTKTFHVGALIKPIWAGFKVPIFNAHPSEQPLGGVSDLSNKGDFDKLLISEFANDDLIFMNRIANNEALYIQREMPPVKDEQHRNILIDISLKSWGTPKILAFATYIAIARHPKSSGETRAFAVGNQCLPVSCSNETEIIDGLQKVDAGLHAAKGLAAFLEINKHDKQLELFFITTADAIKHPDVQKQITSHSPLFKYIITTDAEGEVIFYRRTNNAQKHLQTIRLPLAKLWTKEAPKTEKQQPLIPVASLGSAPMLMPTPMHITKRIPYGDDIYIIADKCLYKRSIEENKKNNKGWQVLLRDVPANSFYELGRAASGEVQFLSFNPQNKALCITNLDTLQQAKTSFTSWSGKRYPQFLFNKYRQFIYLVKNLDSFILEPDFNTGNINVKEQLLTSNIYELDYPKRQKEINDAPAVFPTNVLKNISEVYINQSNYLVFNKHQLNAYDGNIISLSTNSSSIKVVKATKYSNVLFRFKDGSKVLIDRSGFITMTSSNHDIPDIFIVPAMDANLGIATSREFAGSEFYFNRNLAEVNVRIEETGTNRLSVIKIVKEYSGLGLADVHEAVVSSNGKIPAKIYYDDAVKMIAALKEIGCIATIHNQKHQPQNIISARAFYLQNISTFIGHIINYATSD